MTIYKERVTTSPPCRVGMSEANCFMQLERPHRMPDLSSCTWYQQITTGCRNRRFCWLGYLSGFFSVVANPRIPHLSLSLIGYEERRISLELREIE